MKDWFIALAPRERLMLGAMAAFIVLAVLYLGVWEPLHAGVARLRQQVTQQRELVGWLNDTAPEIRALRSATHRSAAAGKKDKSLLTVVDKTSKAAGMAGMLKRIQPEGNSAVQVWVSDATFDDMLGWLYRLQNRYGIAVKTVNVDPADQIGQVNGRLRLSRKSGS
jgi:general secretion pathway protein M